MSQTDKKYSINDFLNQYESKGIKETYKIYLRKYIKNIYPESQLDYDQLSLQYVSMTRDFRADLIKHLDENEKDSPNTWMVRFSSILRWLEVRAKALDGLKPSRYQPSSKQTALA